MRTALAATILLAIPAMADPPVDLSRLVEEVRAQFDIPAMEGALVGPAGVTALGVAGVRRKGDATPVTAADRWHLGSCTKAMTATLIGRLVEQGDLRWDSTVGGVLGKTYPKMHPDVRTITLLDLLGHRSGLAANPSVPQMLNLQLLGKGGPSKARRWLLETWLAAKPERPRNHWQYSNLGYTIAGAMAGTAGGKPWEQLIREKLFAPLKMTTAGFGPPGKPGTPPDQPRGHRGGPLEPGATADNPQAIAPAGTVHCSLEDWARFAALHLRGASGEQGLLLEPATFTRLHRALDGQPKYACGWLVHEPDWGAGTVLTHSGSNTMWFCTASVVPGRKVAILVTANSASKAAQQACQRLHQRLVMRAIRGR